MEFCHSFKVTKVLNDFEKTCLLPYSNQQDQITLKTTCNNQYGSVLNFFLVKSGQTSWKLDKAEGLVKVTLSYETMTPYPLWYHKQQFPRGDICFFLEQKHALQVVNGSKTVEHQFVNVFKTAIELSGT